MRVFLTLATLLLLAVALVLGGCGTSGSDIEKVNLTFGGVSAIDENGNVSVTKGEDFTAVASLVYSGEGPVTGEWTVDGTTKEVEASLPARDKVDEDDSEFATFPLELALPTSSSGVHDVSFTLKSPRKIETNSISYTVSNAAPPANANEYSVSFRLGKGFCITSAEPAIKGKEELALAITIANIKSQSETRVLVEGDAGKIYPPGQKIDTTEGAPFDWNSSIGGPWTLDATDTLNIKAYLYEIDAGGFIDAVLQANVGFTVTGGDDYIGSVARDISPTDLAEASAAPANPSGTGYTVPASFSGSPLQAGEKVYLLDFSNGGTGHFMLELIVKVQS